jgi:hypothetical protein
MSFRLREVMGIKGIPTPYGAPNANAHVERFHRSLREEAHTHFIFLNARHILQVCRKDVNYDNGARPSQTLRAIFDPCVRCHNVGTRACRIFVRVRPKRRRTVIERSYDQLPFAVCVRSHGNFADYGYEFCNAVGPRTSSSALPFLTPYSGLPVLAWRRDAFLFLVADPNPLWLR